jgi:hypothetical protein
MSFLSLFDYETRFLNVGDTVTGHATSRLQDNWVVSVRPLRKVSLFPFMSNFIFSFFYLCVSPLSFFF